ncbi:MAG: enoyl-CoA hydratase/isomerase family protein [Paracoccaceae bacterium]
MTEIRIRIEGRAGRITLCRPGALNALSYEMCLAIDAALGTWAQDPAVALVVIDAEGDKAFCAGGDIAEMYQTGTAGDFDYGRRFWRDEYRMNARLAEFPRPVISLMQGFTMGGGVGVGCHGSHRVVCESSKIAMPECGIGLVPDVGGSALLARAPGRLGAYLGLTGTRMGPADAILAGFADLYVPRAAWADLVAELERSGAAEAVSRAAEAPPEGTLDAAQPQIDRLFAGVDLPAIRARLASDSSPLAQSAVAALDRNCPLSMGCTLEMLRHLQETGAGIRDALAQEYRFTYRAMAQGDFIEGIRAAIIDKDRNPRWQHRLDDLPPEAVARMLAPLGAAELTFEEEATG